MNKTNKSVTLWMDVGRMFTKERHQRCLFDEAEQTFFSSLMKSEYRIAPIKYKNEPGKRGNAHMTSSTTLVLMGVEAQMSGYNLSNSRWRCPPLEFQ